MVLDAPWLRNTPPGDPTAGALATTRHGGPIEPRPSVAVQVVKPALTVAPFSALGGALPGWAVTATTKTDALNCHPFASLVVPVHASRAPQQCQTCRRRLRPCSRDDSARTKPPTSIDSRPRPTVPSVFEPVKASVFGTVVVVIEAVLPFVTGAAVVEVGAMVVGGVVAGAHVVVVVRYPTRRAYRRCRLWLAVPRWSWRSDPFCPL